MTPIIWSIAGTDSGGGAGLSADQRAADAFGVHLCPVVAAVTAQSTVAVNHVQAMATELLDAQLAALANDMPPRVIKTGLLGSAANARLVANWVDRLRRRAPLKLVIDPVLRASTGAGFADEALLQVYRDELLPRASVVTPNQREAVVLLGARGSSTVPALATTLQELGAQTVVVTGGDTATPQLSLDWLQTPHARGWLSLPRVEGSNNHGTGCTFATALAAALARGFVAADAAVLAKMATTHALRQARAVGQGAGPVIAMPGFGTDPSLLPHLSLCEQPPIAWPAPHRGTAPGVYAIVDSAERVEAVLRARPTVPTIQLRMKRPPHLDDTAWATQLTQAIQRSQRAADAAGATLVVNDHWQLALQAGARALHLGQEDLLALTPQDHEQLQAARQRGVTLGLSSHSLWELCRAAGMAPDLIACGPVWPTTTKDMPWRPQGLDNLAWWAHMAPAPVVGIGGVLEPAQLQAVAAAGAAGGCVVRGLGAEPSNTLPAWLGAWHQGVASRQPGVVPPLPHPMLPTS
ncbi:bifunctional hydroxymethylpyrimidine kinase/phosphomethylpyrimidine kinase [Hydrogenophaga sp. A37]|uniref:bifunctional hydroxymethylpyrimidine kinase/phosphomethylpyrimidine kinase n=1 Tax=Hydrogenophaga sp. A37 TaxID=1945864 RepID=UPI00098722EE|nr:bifunctional hydroxymethylpyrimidine kinase/phosphomethylpyrimidine kinase [Hydrogenophaga sp. A37]OOG81068.1 bifunctional hydroxymethylpyrimidine kinase/phosphomethylpyrimidine kinase [Hydrogenophaga sp. A37]